MLGDVDTWQLVSTGGDTWCHVAVYVLGTSPMDGCNPEEDEHTLTVTCARVCAFGDGAMMMVLAAT